MAIRSAASLASPATLPNSGEKWEAVMSVEDKLDILECLAAYSHTLDNGDDEGWVQLFTEDAVWEAFPKGSETPNIRYEGHDGIRRFAAAMRARSNGSQARHCKGNTI